MEFKTLYLTIIGASCGTLACAVALYMWYSCCWSNRHKRKVAREVEGRMANEVAFDDADQGGRLLVIIAR